MRTLFSLCVLAGSLLWAPPLYAVEGDRSFADGQAKLLQRLEKLDARRAQANNMMNDLSNPNNSSGSSSGSNAANNSLGTSGFNDLNSLDPKSRQSASFISLLPSDVHLLRDIPYGPDIQQKMTLFRAKNGKVKNSPLIILVHGGGVFNKEEKSSPGVIANKVAHWLPMGYSVLSINYRTNLPLLQQVHDVGQAVLMAQNKALEWGANPNRIVLMGHFTGAQLVGLLSVDNTLSTSIGLKPWAGSVLLDNAVYDVPALMTLPHSSIYDRLFESNAPSWYDLSASYRVHRSAVPMFLVCSSLNNYSCPQAEQFAKKSQILGNRVQISAQPLNLRAINGELGLPNAYTNTIDEFLFSVGF